MTNYPIDPVEAALTDVLERRASQVTVRDDLEAVLQAAASPVSAAGRSGQQLGTRWLFAAAVLVIIAAGASVVTRISDRTEVGTDAGDTGLGSPEELAAAAIADRDATDLIIWLKPEVEPASIESVSRRLDGHPEVDSYRYIDQSATYREFVEYYADQPEVIGLVSAEQLPTSFRVTTSDQLALAEIAEALPGVVAVDVAD